jgi:hypothetical protein
VELLKAKPLTARKLSNQQRAKARYGVKEHQL